MKLPYKIFKLNGKIQHYAWGGFEFIPSLLGVENTDNKPCAEYWMGAHPSASSTLLVGNEKVSLFELIQEDARTLINEKVFSAFGELPYLFKILDVKDMLSIQVHPSKIEAEKGFDWEEKAGIPINAPNRNYKDKNHKPEVMVALSDEFWLLHGFKKKEAIEKTLLEVQDFNVLQALYKKDGLKAMYRFVMEMDQAEVDTLLTPLVKREIRRKKNNELTREDAGWWVSKLYETDAELKNIDKGIFSIYFFNIVKVLKGEAVFQGAGIPHAYLEGQNAELMANSDNVLRGGLTPKHVDVPELMKHTLFEGITPNVMKGKTLGAFGSIEKNYPCPVSDFGINKIELTEENKYASRSTSLEMMILVEGAAVINGSDGAELHLTKGEVVAVLPEEQYSLSTSTNCVIFKAYVPE